ncbi:MAG TPA: A/G-specific adenine glycosylase [Dehalococcoidia bacterium]|nr:A/G-specific adenine glycosylase [Dehalococcoidia bacterium]
MTQCVAPDPDPVRDRILSWYARHGRDLPWRQTRDPYAILVAEVMLQQTGVERVLPKFAEFLAAYPTIQSLAAAPRAEVIRRWAPLGYNLRAVRLHEIAQVAVRDFGGALPPDRDALRQLRGIGDYTAGAIACFAFGDDRAFLDTNIRRVLGRIFHGGDLPKTAAGERRARAIADAALPRGRVYDWHQALMDLGATVCRATAPACLICPVRDFCRYAAGDHPKPAVDPAPAKPAGAFVGSSRYYRGRVVDHLRGADDRGLALDQIGAAIKADYTPADRAWLGDLVGRLERDGLVRRVAEDVVTYRLADGSSDSKSIGE